MDDIATSAPRAREKTRKSEASDDPHKLILIGDAPHIVLGRARSLMETWDQESNRRFRKREKPPMTIV
jgi:hypothetical protein